MKDYLSPTTIVCNLVPKTEEHEKFGDLVGTDDIIDKLKITLLPFKLKRLNLCSREILIFGPNCCGKNTLAMCIAAELDLPLAVDGQLLKNFVEIFRQGENFSAEGTSCCSDVKNDAKTKKHEVTLFQIVDAKQKADVEGSTEFFASAIVCNLISKTGIIPNDPKQNESTKSSP
ncbi:hypothetical protein HELRODRAFT_173917 [Helobdella robusta]|uniref:Uncharacterized protein n=1 Tax=Helobdella robusta TaxID=6412 RepID=T1F7D6_HELRO|nr:hypothetical protein HELRODRAFT_173917 [Helobdella robusta]ESO03048.1 hypothetical protein HELRODRAFT_173917 [Helobdella robusta]